MKKEWVERKAGGEGVEKKRERDVLCAQKRKRI